MNNLRSSLLKQRLVLGAASQNTHCFHPPLGIVIQKIMIDVQAPNADPKLIEAAGFLAAGSAQFAAMERLLGLLGVQ